MEKPTSGILVADKPEGITSQTLVSKIKRILNVRSAGHTGTLDPIATGLNLVCYGRATKVSAYVTGCDKTYIARLRLGYETDTGDITGETIATNEKRATAEELLAVLPQFLGPQAQIPPMYSAIKLDGKKLYQLARAGETVEVAPRDIVIYDLKLLEADEANGEFSLLVDCSKGTYIRSLCRDLGRALGTCGTMAALRRIRVGSFTIDQALTPDQMAQKLADGDTSFILPIDAVFAELGNLTVNADGERLIRCGAVIPSATVTACDRMGEMCRVYNEAGEFLAIGKTEGEELCIEKRFFDL
ncbi:MAG: tRNA pseudouridine(55) synthase TruB [Clostridia bacterium]|nr:tRNA pseudouridine(55) synthase TruB [Clostridia bacterium]